MNIKLEQKQTHQLILTPQIKLAIHILQLPLMELGMFFKQQIVENPLLEEIEECDEEKDPERDEAIEFEKRVDNLLRLDDGRTDFSGKLRNEDQENFYKENIPSKNSSLHEHLTMQLNIFFQSDLQKTIGEAIISNIDKNGYLRISLEEIAQELKANLEDAKKTLFLIQSFSPLGVGAGSLSECLFLQLKRKGKEHSLAGKIIKTYLADLEKRRFKKIAKKLSAKGGSASGEKVSIDEVKKAFSEISRLEPKPGRSFGEECLRYKIPDILLVNSGDEYKIEFNSDTIPRFRINFCYKRLLKDRDIPSETKEYLKEKLKQALWLLKSISRRQDTMKKVAEYIIEIQKDFLDDGPSFIKPLTLKEVAQSVGVSESTVSRIVANKYIDTPYGIYELRCFFNGEIRQNNGKRLSVESVKARVKELIDNENHQKPLSDEAITKTLHPEGINIARRTVTKYRKLLRIFPSNIRKEGG